VNIRFKQQPYDEDREEVDERISRDLTKGKQKK